MTHYTPHSVPHKTRHLTYTLTLHAPHLTLHTLHSAVRPRFAAFARGTTRRELEPATRSFIAHLQNDTLCGIRYSHSGTVTGRIRESQQLRPLFSPVPRLPPKMTCHLHHHHVLRCFAAFAIGTARGGIRAPQRGQAATRADTRHQP